MTELMTTTNRPATKGSDEEPAGAWWCSYGTRHAINESCTCAPQNVLTAALPHHPLMDVWAAERAEYMRLRRADAAITTAVLNRS